MRVGGNDSDVKNTHSCTTAFSLLPKQTTCLVYRVAAQLMCEQKRLVMCPYYAVTHFPFHELVC